jgi:adenylate cyclase
VPFWHVLDPNNWAFHQAQRTFAGKLVLIGPTAASLQDIKLTPTTNTMPGVEVHAHTLATLMEGRALGPITDRRWLSAAMAGLLLGLGGLTLGWRVNRPLLRLGGFAAIALLWGGLAYGLLISHHRWVPLAVPVSVLGLGSITYTATGALGDRREQQRIRRTLERYVAPAVVAEILAQPDDYSVLIGGKRLPAAVLFSDIRGFSRLSFQLPAEAMVGLLNTYLDAMVKAILAHRGTLDKFIGDAVMAEFGSPTSQGAQTDALNAIRAGLAMRRSLAESAIALTCHRPAAPVPRHWHQLRRGGGGQYRFRTAVGIHRHRRHGQRRQSPRRPQQAPRHRFCHHRPAVRAGARPGAGGGFGPAPFGGARGRPGTGLRCDRVR